LNLLLDDQFLGTSFILVLPHDRLTQAGESSCSSPYLPLSGGALNFSTVLCDAMDNGMEFKEAIQTLFAE